MGDRGIVCGVGVDGVESGNDGNGCSAGVTGMAAGGGGGGRLGVDGDCSGGGGVIADGCSSSWRWCIIAYMSSGLFHEGGLLKSHK